MKLDVAPSISITLTQEQIDSIENQKNPKLNADNIDYKSAKALLAKYNIDPDPRGLFNGDLLTLVTIICAINFINNDNKEWIADFDNTKQIKYLPYFEKKSSGWSYYFVYSYSFYSSYPAGLFYFNEKSASIIAKRYLNTLYKTCLG